jgi:hypothetical protein
MTTDRSDRRQRELRDQVITGMWEDGATYADIRDKLGLTARQVEAVLGQAAALRAAGHSFTEIGRRIGLSRSTIQGLFLTDKRQLSARANAVVEALAEMYGMQVDVLGWMFKMEPTHVYRLVRELRTHRLVVPQLIEVRKPGAKWVVPTGAAAASYLGWQPRTVWRPGARHAEHYRAVAQARVMLVGADPELWVAERYLRHAAEVRAWKARTRSGRGSATAGAHIHDGRFLGAVGGEFGWWALEVELTQKSTTNLDLAMRGAIQSARDAEPDPVTGLLYLCRGAGVLRAVGAAYDRLPIELARVPVKFAIGDFDEEWTKFLRTRETMRTANRPQRPSTVVRDLGRAL